MVKKLLYRDDENKVIGGVCQGLADYFDADVSFVRILAVILFFVSGLGLILYIVAWIVFPTKKEVMKKTQKKKK